MSSFKKDAFGDTHDGILKRGDLFSEVTVLMRLVSNNRSINFGFSAVETVGTEQSYESNMGLLDKNDAFIWHIN